jgi:hypothetical protein
MGWETRERGGQYYARSRRVDGRVRRVYVGGGILGKVAALKDEYERRLREEEAAFWREERERLEERTAFLKEVTAATDILVRAHLVAGGFHKRKGEWRRERT